MCLVKFLFDPRDQAVASEGIVGNVHCQFGGRLGQVSEGVVDEKPFDFVVGQVQQNVVFS